MRTVKFGRARISVIMPAYNVEGFIDQAIQSVLNQKRVLFELLILDDASTDHTWARIFAYRCDPRVRIFRFYRNRGAAAGRNYLISKAKGIYISVCDADDRLLPGNLAIFSKILSQKSAVGAVYGDWVEKARKSRRIKVKHRFEYRGVWDLLGRSLGNGGIMMRRSAIKKTGGYRTKFKYAEDFDLLMRLSEVSKLHYFKKKPLYFRNERSGSLSDQPERNLRMATNMILRDAIWRRYGLKVKW